MKSTTTPMTRKNIQELDQQIQKIQQKKAKELAKEVRAIVKAMQSLGITLSQLKAAGADKVRRRKAKSLVKAKKSSVSRKKAVVNVADKRSNVTPKYRNDGTGDVWSGRGKAPKWMMEMERMGRKREEFLVK